MSENIRVAKWHPAFGKDLEIALEATLNKNADFNYDSNLLNSGMIHLLNEKRKVYHPAVVEDNSTSKRTVRFIPCFAGKVEYFRLCLWGKGISKKPFFIRFARFGEDKTFGFNDSSRPYIGLDFFSKRSETFIPVFVKVLDRESGEMIFLVIEGAFVEAENSIVFTIRKISASEVPPILL